METTARTHTQHVAWNTTAQIVGKLISAGATLVGSVLIARRFGVTAYGDFTKVITFIAPFYLIADFGMNAIFLQKKSLETHKKIDTNDDWSTLVTLRITGSLALLFIALGVLSFLPHGYNQGYTPLVRLGIILFAPTIVFQSLLTTANALFQKHLRYDLSAIATSIGVSLGTLLVWIVTIVFSDALGVTASIGSLGIGSFVAMVVAYMLSHRFASRVIFQSFSKHVLPFFIDALPLGLTLIFNIVYFRIDSFILTLTRSTQEVGVYGFAYKFFEFPLAIPTFFMNAAYPLLLQIIQKNNESTRGRIPALIIKSAKILFVSSLVAVLFFWFLSPFVSWVRPEFQASVTPLRILSLGLPFFFLTSVTMWTLVAYKKQAMLLGIYGVSMLGNILANIIFIPAYGYMAAAWITVFSELCVLGLSWVAMRKLFVFQKPNYL